MPYHLHTVRRKHGAVCSFVLKHSFADCEQERNAHVCQKKPDRALIAVRERQENQSFLNFSVINRAAALVLPLAVL